MDGADGVADLPLLIVTRVIAVTATENYGACELCVAKFSMRSLTPASFRKSCCSEINDQLADFAWHART